VARTTAEAATLASATPPDVVIASAALLRDAADARGLRLVPALADVPLILLAAPDDLVERLAAVRASATQVLGRPAPAADVLAAVRGLADASAGRRRPRVAVVGPPALCEALRLRGFDASVTAADPEPLVASEPDALLVDGRAPEAALLLEGLRADPRLRAMPTLVLCDGDDPAARVRALELGAGDALAPTTSEAELAT